MFWFLCLNNKNINHTKTTNNKTYQNVYVCVIKTKTLFPKLWFLLTIVCFLHVRFRYLFLQRKPLVIYCCVSSAFCFPASKHLNVLVSLFTTNIWFAVSVFKQQTQNNYSNNNNNNNNSNNNNINNNNNNQHIVITVLNNNNQQSTITLTLKTITINNQH